MPLVQLACIVFVSCREEMDVNRRREFFLRDKCFISLHRWWLELLLVRCLLFTSASFPVSPSLLSVLLLIFSWDGGGKEEGRGEGWGRMRTLCAVKEHCWLCTCVAASFNGSTQPYVTCSSMGGTPEHEAMYNVAYWSTGGSCCSLGFMVWALLLYNGLQWTYQSMVITL